jgi:hypothetical protein
MIGLGFITAQTMFGVLATVTFAENAVTTTMAIQCTLAAACRTVVPIAMQSATTAEASSFVQTVLHDRDKWPIALLTLQAMSAIVASVILILCVGPAVNQDATSSRSVVVTLQAMPGSLAIACIIVVELCFVKNVK